MSEKTSKEIAAIIVDKIIDDLSDRRGLDNEWYSIDADIRKGIIEEWERIAEKEISEGTL